VWKFRPIPREPLSERLYDGRWLSEVDFVGTLYSLRSEPYNPGFIERAASEAHGETWRNCAISRRHHQWGLNCPCVDIDFLVPGLVVDFKHLLATPSLLARETDPSHIAVSELCDRSGWMYCIVVYWDFELDHCGWVFQPVPRNHRCSEHFGRLAGTRMSEHEWSGHVRAIAGVDRLA
jgi:hypothetical protein